MAAIAGAVCLRVRGCCLGDYTRDGQVFHALVA
jgi:hypothetical protein